MNKTFIPHALAWLAAWTLALPLAQAAAPGALERIQSAGSVTVCADPANLPISGNSPAPAGYDIEIAQELARTLGARLEYHWFATHYARRAFRQLIEGRCDYIMGLPANIDFEEADARMALTQAYYTTGFVPVVRADLPVQHYQDLRGRDIGVEMMTVADFALFRQDQTRRLYRRQQDIFEALAGGEIEAALMWGPFAGWLTRQRPDARLRVVAEAPPELVFSLAIGVRKTDADLRQALDQGVDTLRRSGRLAEILARHGVPLLTPARPQAQAAPRPVLLAAQSLREPGASVSDLDEPPWLLAMGGGSTGAPNESPEVGKGRRLYEQACYKCHGPGAISGGTIPDLRHFKGDEADFLGTVREGRVARGMPAWKEFLDDEEIRAIRRFVKSVPVQ